MYTKWKQASAHKQQRRLWRRRWGVEVGGWCWWEWVSEKIKISSFSYHFCTVQCICPLRIKHEMSFFPSPYPLFLSFSWTFFYIILYLLPTQAKNVVFLWMSYDVDFNAQGLNVNFFLFLFCFHAVMQTEREKLFFYSLRLQCLMSFH